MPLLQSPLQVLYTRRSGNAYHRALQTSWRGWADSKAVHSMECVGGALALLEGSLSRGCCLQCSVLLALEGVLPNLELELSHKEPKQQTPQVLCPGGIYIAGDTLRHQPMGMGHMTVLQFRGPITFCVLQWCHPMLTRTLWRTSCSTRMITLYGVRKRIQARAIFYSLQFLCKSFLQLLLRFEYLRHCPFSNPWFLCYCLFLLFFLCFLSSLLFCLSYFMSR